MSHPHTLAQLQAHYGQRYRWLLLLTVMIGTTASIMSSTIINVAGPDMSRFFGLGQDRLQWVSSGFMVAMTASMLTTSWWLTRFGYRKTYAGAVALLLARVAEGLASGVLLVDWRGLLLVGRVGQGFTCPR